MTHMKTAGKINQHHSNYKCHTSFPETSPETKYNVVETTEKMNTM